MCIEWAGINYPCTISDSAACWMDGCLHWLGLPNEQAGDAWVLQRCSGLNRTGLAGPPQDEPQDNIAAEFSVTADAASQNRAKRDFGLWLCITYITNFRIFRGSCTQPHSPIRAKFGTQEYTHGLHLHDKFHSDWFTVSPFSSRQPHILVHCVVASSSGPELNMSA